MHKQRARKSAWWNNGWLSFDNERKERELVGHSAINLRGGLFHIHTYDFWQNKCQNLQPYDSKMMHYMVSYRFWMKSNSNTFIRTWHDKQKTLLFQTAVCLKLKKKTKITTVTIDDQNAVLPTPNTRLLFHEKLWEDRISLQCADSLR